MPVRPARLHCTAALSKLCLPVSEPACDQTARSFKGSQLELSTQRATCCRPSIVSICEVASVRIDLLAAALDQRLGSFGTTRLFVSWLQCTLKMRFCLDLAGSAKGAALMSASPDPDFASF